MRSKLETKWWPNLVAMMNLRGRGGLEGVADQGFGGVVSVAFRGVDEIDAEVESLPEDGGDFGLGVVFRLHRRRTARFRC